MSLKNPKVLVVDASIARAASDDIQKIHPTALACAHFLKEIKMVGHFMVLTPQIEAEWKKHESLFSKKWRSEMFSRKQIVWLKQAEVWDEDLRIEIRHLITDDDLYEVIIKDVLLLEGASATDQCVASNERRIRLHFHNLSELIEKIGEIIWVNPTIEDENIILWLREGAPPNEERKLKNYAQD